jgi:hypothetical protein
MRWRFFTRSPLPAFSRLREPRYVPNSTILWPDRSRGRARRLRTGRRENQVLLERVADGFANPDDAKSVLARTETAYLGLFIDRDPGPGLRLLAIGRYPRSIARALSPRRRGGLVARPTERHGTRTGRRRAVHFRARALPSLPRPPTSRMIGRLSGGDALLPRALRPAPKARSCRRHGATLPPRSGFASHRPAHSLPDLYSGGA